MNESILDMLFDEENSENITLYDENDNPMEFEQIAVIPLKEQMYVLLLPLDPAAIGLGEDEAVVFAVTEADGEANLAVVQDDETIDAVFAEYYRLLEEAGDGEE